MSSAILASVLVAGEDVPAVELDVGPRQAVVEKQPDDPRYGDVEIHRRDPVMPIRLEVPPELADLTPALKIVCGILALLERDNLGEVAEQQGKRPPGAHDADRHVMLIQHKDVAVQTRLILSCYHGSQITCCICCLS